MNQYEVTLIHITWDTTDDEGTHDPDELGLPDSIGPIIVHADDHDHAIAQAVDLASDANGWLISDIGSVISRVVT